MIRMMDTIGACATNIPATAPKVAGYVTGYSPVPWYSQHWGRFTNAGHIRIKQNPGPSAALISDVIDVESGAATVDDAVQYVSTRISAGIQWSTIYATRLTLRAIHAKLFQKLGTKFYGHVDCWLADWNLNEHDATALLATAAQNNMVEGFTCRAVQWASPESNPNTLVPGTSTTLSKANVDLSVTQDEWYAHGSNWNK